MINKFSLRALVLPLLLATSLLACGDDGGEEPEFNCSTSTLSYENFGKSFMQDYCLDCHSKTSINRQKAPASINFDTLVEIEKRADRVNARSGIGNSMPPRNFASQPSDAEHVMLQEWIFCETP